MVIKDFISQRMIAYWRFELSKLLSEFAPRVKIIDLPDTKKTLLQQAAGSQKFFSYPLAAACVLTESIGHHGTFDVLFFQIAPARSGRKIFSDAGRIGKSECYWCTPRH